MNVIINAPRGIIIPEIPVTVSLDKKTVTFGSIDKLKYNKFLELGITCVCYSISFDIKAGTYIGDELVISNSDDAVYFYAICLKFQGF